MVSRKNRYGVMVLVLIYCSVQLYVAFSSTRCWPFTDYPMFSDPVYKNDPIFVYKYYLIEGNDEKVAMKRSFLNGYGLGELNITKLYLNGESEKFKKVLVKWMNENTDKTSIQGIKLFKVVLDRKSLEQKKEFKVSEEEVFFVQNN